MHKITIIFTGIYSSKNILPVVMNCVVMHRGEREKERELKREREREGKRENTV